MHAMAQRDDDEAKNGSQHREQRLREETWKRQLQERDAEILRLQAEAAQVQAVSREGEVLALKAELAKIAEEGNSKIDAANERIRSLRRDDAVREVDRLTTENRQIREERNALVDEKDILS